MKRFAVFSLESVSHLRLLLPLVEELLAAGHEAHVFTGASLAGEVERTGAVFHDLFEEAAIEEVDASSVPVPCRSVAHAGALGDRIAERVRSLAPDLVVYELFAVIGVVVARELGVPSVCVLAGHASVPDRVLADIRSTRQVEISAACLAAVARLRDVHAIVDAHPLMYNDAVSPTLNLYPEPREHLPEADRTAFGPLDYLGSVTPGLREGRGPSPFRSRGRRRVLAAIGTVVWRYFEADAAQALRAVAEACALAGDELVVGLGGAQPSGGLIADLRTTGATVVDDVDQWAALADADVFITHHGLNSTHEAIYQRTPMLSYPFFGDQPAAAARCAELGLAVPLVTAPRAPLTPEGVLAGLATVDARRGELGAALEVARGWERRTIEDRPRVAARVVDLAG